MVKDNIGKSIIIGLVSGMCALSVFTTISVAQVVAIEKPVEVRTEILRYKAGAVERLSPTEYLQRKQLLQNDYVANKTAKTGYDFDVNNLPLLEAVLEKESKARGEVNLVGATKDDIREYILGLVGITP